MIETEDQRRWWFATHPEYSWSRTGRRLSKQLPKNEDPVKQEWMRRMMAAGEHDRKKLEETWEKIEAQRRITEPVEGVKDVAEIISIFSRLIRAIKILREVGRVQNVVKKTRPPARLPPKGTPERAKIERDRAKGRERKKAQELEDIRAGGKGSGVWTEKELERIRKTRGFPPDTVWHHDPTVANRPDLAADPRSVHPLRGGRKAHLRDGHNYNWQNPRPPHNGGGECRTMKTGLLERIMVRRYGQPITSITDGMAARRWNTDRPDYDAVLYVGMRWQGILGARYSSLKEIYGDSFGGYLVKNSLKVAMLSPRSVYGLWNIDEFRSQPEIRYALTLDPGVDYFMDQDMVLFYGIKRGQLYVFDSETDELDSLGPVEPALEKVLDELDAVIQDL